jgi:hypothetical protein
MFAAALSAVLVSSAAPVSTISATEAARAAPSQFATGQYGLTFSVPKGATYCALPKDWAGSDHGTTVFLDKPEQCGGVGFPSSSRGFEPRKLARIELFYSYWMGEDEPRDGPCHKVATIIFLGARRPVCEGRQRGVVLRSVKARYLADIEAEAVLRLVTRPERLRADMRTFERTAASFRTCKTVWHGPNGRFTVGQGALCPRSSRWF